MPKETSTLEQGKPFPSSSSYAPKSKKNLCKLPVKEFF